MSTHYTRQRDQMQNRQCACRLWKSQRDYHLGYSIKSYSGAEDCPYNGRMSDSQSPWVTFYKIIRWVLLAVFILVIVVLLRKPTPPALPIAADAAKEDLQTFNDKVDRLADSHARNEPGEARFTADEVNAAIAHSLGADAVSAQPAEVQPATSAGETPPEIRTVQVGFFDDQVTGQFATPIYGKQVYITLSGRLGEQDGYATFEPTAFRVGDLDVPLVSVVKDALQRKLAEPENREKFKLPDYVSGLKIENGELVITEK